MTDRLTVEDFARVPWGGMAINEDGRKAARVPDDDEDPFPWREFDLGDWGRKTFWRSDEYMSADLGWRILPTVTTAREALETLTDAEWEKVAYAVQDWVWRAEEGEWVPNIADALLDAVTPAPVPEPWEEAPYVIVIHKDNSLAVMKNTGDGYLDHHGAFWTRSQVASMNPRPFDPSEVPG